MPSREPASPRPARGSWLYLDEVGWQVDTAAHEGYDGLENVAVTDEGTQAAIYGQLVRRAACDPDIAQVNVFGFRDDRARAGFQAGLHRLDGTPRPAADAVRAAVSDGGCAGRASGPWRPARAVLGAKRPGVRVATDDIAVELKTAEAASARVCLLPGAHARRARSASSPPASRRRHMRVRRPRAAEPPNDRAPSASRRAAHLCGQAKRRDEPGARVHDRMPVCVPAQRRITRAAVGAAGQAWNSSRSGDGSSPPRSLSGCASASATPNQLARSRRGPSGRSAVATGSSSPQLKTASCPSPDQRHLRLVVGVVGGVRGGVADSTRTAVGWPYILVPTYTKPSIASIPTV